MPPVLVESLKANSFDHPTEVQARSLVYLKSHVDMVIAARTGQGKTLCFGIPILELCILKLQKALENGEESPKIDSIKGLIIAPTRELAI